MWIRVQEESRIVNARIIEISKGIFKKSKYTIVGKVTNATDEMNVILGTYDDEETAKRVFSDIEQAIIIKKELFVMPESI